MPPNIPQEIIDTIIDQVAFMNTDGEMRDAQARMDLPASGTRACGLDLLCCLPPFLYPSFLRGRTMPSIIPHDTIDTIIDQVAFMNTDWEMRDPQTRNDPRASGGRRRACGLGIYNTLYLSSCALVARSWVWSSRSHQFRTLHFVYPRQLQQLSGLLGLIRSPLCTINNHIFEINTLLASDMMALASLSKLRSIELRGSPWPGPPDVAFWPDGLPTLLASFAHLTILEISFVPFKSLSQFATLVSACSKLQTLTIKIADIPLGSPSDTYLPRHFPPPSALRSLRITESGGGCDALYDWLVSAPKPLPIDSIVIQNYGREYTASLLGLLRNAGPSLENIAINTGYTSEGLHQPPLPDLNPYPQLQSFTCRWSMYIDHKSPAAQAAEICTAIGQISSSCMRTIDIIIDMYNPGDIEQLALQMIDPYLQRSDFASLKCLTFFTRFFELEIVQNWARESFPVCFQRGIVQLRKKPPQL